MLRPRSSRYPALTRYFALRPSPPILPTNGFGRGQTLALAALSGVSGLAVLSSGSHLAVAAGLAAIGGSLTFAGLRTKKPAPPTPEQELAAKADAVVREIHPYIQWNRLHRAFHPGVVAVLEECAAFHARVLAALDEGSWSHRPGVRESALAAANLAMDEALVQAGKTLPYVAEAKPLENLSDTLEEIGFGPLTRSRSAGPMPPAFRPVRDLAERLRELAERCEAAARELPEGHEEPVSAAFRRLDAALGEMRGREQAEQELRQGA